MFLPVQALSRPYRPDETPFAVNPLAHPEQEWQAVILTEYAEITAAHFVKGARAGTYVVQTPEGPDILDAAGFYAKYRTEPEELPSPTVPAEPPGPYDDLGWDELRAEAKARGIPANQTRAKIIEALNG